MLSLALPLASLVLGATAQVFVIFLRPALSALLLSHQPPPRSSPTTQLPLLRQAVPSSYLARPSPGISPPKELKCKLTAFSCSLFDHTNHVFGGPPVAFDSQNTCITYDAVNAAFISARDRVGLPPVRGKFTTHDVGNLGTVIHEASR